MKTRRPNTLKLPPRLRHRLCELVAAGYPEETCGVLLGIPTKGGIEILDLVQAPNLNRERPRERYALDPGAFAAADARARARGQDIVGIWHSHPDHPAIPSRIDREGAWPGWSYLIASVGHEGLEELRSWRLEGERFAEEDLREEEVESWHL